MSEQFPKGYISTQTAKNPENKKGSKYYTVLIDKDTICGAWIVKKYPSGFIQWWDNQREAFRDFTLESIEKEVRAALINRMFK